MGARVLLTADELRVAEMLDKTHMRAQANLLSKAWAEFSIHHQYVCVCILVSKSRFK